MLVLSAISFLLLAISRLFLGGWIDLLWIPFGMFIVSFIFHIILDIKSYWSLLTLKTTRNGMNLGFSLLILLVILSSAAYLSLLWDKTFDLTEEKLHSLSDQTVKTLDSMRGESLEFKAFYMGGTQEKGRLRRILNIYKQNASFIKIQYIDAHLDNRAAKEYLEPLSDREQARMFIFVEYHSKRVRVDHPFGESEFLSALLQVSKRASQNVYYTVGHGERDMLSSDHRGLSFFQKALESASFNVLEWSFIDQKAPVPEDASALMILGPTKPFFEQEISWIKEYIEKRKGKVFITLDPGAGHNLSDLLKNTLGVDFKNNFLISKTPPWFVQSAVFVASSKHNENHPITRAFSSTQRGMGILFNEVSELGVAADSSFESQTLVYSALAVPVSSLNIKKFKVRPNFQSYPVGLVVQENKSETPQNNESEEEKNKDSKDEENKKEDPGFLAVVFGDSDFLSNAFFSIGFHKDIALNSISYLADQTNLLSIRPKEPKGTRIILTRNDEYFFIIYALLLPLVFFILSGMSWFSRKKA